jgi:hypothetical protein
MPKPSHFQEFRAIGEVKDVIVKGGQVTWIVLTIDQGEACVVPIAPGAFMVPEDLGRGDLLHVRGEIRTEHGQGARHGLPYVVATKVLERLRRGRPRPVAVHTGEHGGSHERRG